MSHRIERRFDALRAQSRQALIPFITAGDPDPNWTVAIMHALVAAGADVVELGVPFSDPMADGPVIQVASERAIARGVSLRTIIGWVAQFRQQDQTTPVVLMGYMNPLERYGHDAFARDAGAAGVDGVLLVDCPPEELEALEESLGAQGISPICLVAPTTTPARMDVIAAKGKGYLYYVSFRGITGADRLDHSCIAAPLSEIRRHTSLPIAVGFGIKGPESAAIVARFADGVVMGSALVEVLAAADSLEDACQRAVSFLAPVRQAMDNEAMSSHG